MAIKVAIASGNYSDATIWCSRTDTSSVNAASPITITTAGVDSVPFTAPNTTNAATGVLIYLVTKPARDLTATLYENGVATAATATILSTNLPAADNWVYFKLATPYVFTTTTASAYKWKIASLVAASGTVASDVTLSLNAHILSLDDRTITAPGAGDVAYIVPPNANTSISVTVDGTAGLLTGGTDNNNASTAGGRARTNSNALYLGGSATTSLALLKWDTSASSKLEATGNIIVDDGGELQMGTIASPYPAAFTAQLKINATSGTAQGLNVFGTGKCYMQGAAITNNNYKTAYVSGSGTTGSPLVVADATGWNVNDAIVIPPASNNATNYNETARKFIKTISGNSLTLSDSAGGIEAGLTFTYNTNSIVFNIQRNVSLINGANSTYFNNGSTIAGNVALKWTSFSGLGSGSTSAVFSPIAGVAMSPSSIGMGAFDYCVIKDSVNSGLYITSRTPQTYTNNITLNASNATATGHSVILSGAANQTFTDLYVILGARAGIFFNSPANISLTRCITWAHNTANISTGGWNVQTSSQIKATNCEVHSCRLQGVSLNGSSGVTFVNCQFGTKGINQTTDLSTVSALTSQYLFDNCLFGSATMLGNYLNAAEGTVIAFNKLNQTANNHRWYTNHGSAQSTGSGLTDTLVKTTGSLGLRLSPEDGTNGFNWQFNIPAPAGQIISFFAWAQKNTAFGTSVAKFELFLPGNDPTTGTADASYTMTNNTGVWEAVSISASNAANTVDLLATVKVTGITSTASAYLYVDTLYNADTTQKLTGLDIWNNGQPATLILPTAVSAADIWTFSTSALTAPSTTGKQLKDALTTGKFIGLS